MAPTGPKIPSFLSPCPAYKGILPLRLLQLEPHLASITSGLMDHSEDKDMEGAGEDEVVRLFKEDWGCSFTEEEIIRADGILDVNSVQHRLEGLKFFSSTSPPLGRSPGGKSSASNHLTLLPFLHQVCPHSALPLIAFHKYKYLKTSPCKQHVQPLSYLSYHTVAPLFLVLQMQVFVNASPPATRSRT